MRSFLLLMALVVLSSLAAFAQSECDPPYRDSTYRYLTSFTVMQTFPEPPQQQPPSKVKGRNKKKLRKLPRGNGNGLGGDNMCAVGVQVCVWQQGQGKFQLVEDLNSMTVLSQNDTCFALDSISTTTLCGILAHDAVVQGINLGLIPCLHDCTTKDTATVWLSSCAKKTGSGQTTHLTICTGAGLCPRNYAFCRPLTPAAQPVVVQIAPSPSPICAPGCEPACN